MGMYTHATLAHLFTLSRRSAPHRAIVALSRMDRVKEALAQAHEMLAPDEQINLTTGEIVFPNGSNIHFYVPHGAVGREAHAVFWEQGVSGDAVNHLLTRERLK